ncbi:MAG: alkaline phosphatase family protein [Terriglobales bacterium]
MPAYANSSFSRTATPIKHLVVIFQENVSFDHYFGTYPNAANPKGEPAFFARPDTPTVNGLSAALLNNGRNIGDLLNEAGVTWGAFMGGFDLTVKNPNGTTGCARSSLSAFTGTVGDYIPHHAFFQYYASTANPTHARPSSVSEIGHDGTANHPYDLNDF